MADKSDTQDYPHLPKIPAKLRQRLDSVGDNELNEKIVGDGELDLRSQHPVKVVEYFLTHTNRQKRESTYDDYSYDLTRFLEYCEYANIDDLAELSSADIEGFRQWRTRDGHIQLSTLHGQLANLRVFVHWCETVEIVQEGLADNIELPDLDPTDTVSYKRLRPEEANKIIEYHQQRDYVAREFAEFVLAWELLFRLGDVRAIDLDDYNSEEQYIELKHRPDEGTPLKNGEAEVEGEGGEREVNLPDWVCDILDTYIDGTGDPNHEKRIEIKDEYGREPLFTTKKGRVSRTTVRRDFYKITQPCRYGQDCPQDINPNECDYRSDSDLYSKCPENTSPHPVRRGGICYQLSQGVNKETICERADVSRKVLNRHYDLREKEEARKQRRNILAEHLDGYEDSSRQSISDPSPVQRELPLANDLARIRRTYGGSKEVPETARLVKGLAGYCLFVLLLGLNFGLLGIRLDPTEFIF